MSVPAEKTVGRMTFEEFLDGLDEDTWAEWVDGPADLVVEVVSPDSIGRDRGEKFIEYETAGVADYWLADPDRGQVEAYHLGTDGRYHPIRPDRRGWLRPLELVGFRLNPAWVRLTPLPPAATARRWIRRPPRP
ncbi:MAG: Uma2 family endonuclease [Acidobacteria bacterium]|nr:Uma2 family endonuclease [Acidobacteriota bacterium]MDW7983934.1 Uma2 family endonuclease [Acidobacteriota bacterium]